MAPFEPLGSYVSLLAISTTAGWRRSLVAGWEDGGAPRRSSRRVGLSQFRFRAARCGARNPV